MSNSDGLDRRSFLASAVVAGGAASLIGTSDAKVSPPLPPDLDPVSSLARYWDSPVHDIAIVDLAGENLDDPVVKECHRIYCGLLMALIRRFWNGNNKGPLGEYPWRPNQREAGASSPPYRYRGDCLDQPDCRTPLDSNRINWDRYLGHNIACLAVDAKGEIIDFDFNHNNLFRSSVEHAEARLVRRLFSLTNVNDSWQTGARIPGKSRSFSLNGVTIYTSLESCAQCSGIMALGGVSRVVYLQSDPGQYRVGNLMFNLADPGTAAKPIPASELGLDCMSRLGVAYRNFTDTIASAKNERLPSKAYFIPPGGEPVYDNSITSFLCSDDAFHVFDDGATAFLAMQSSAASVPLCGSAVMSNDERLRHAMDFYKYADIEGYRGSPHKL